MDSHSSESDKPSSQSTQEPHETDPTQLLSSAQILADATNSTLRHEMDKVDKDKVADAAADLLGAASHYAKLEERSYGKYVEQAEDYLHQYHSSQSSVAAIDETTHSSTSTAEDSSHSSTATAEHSSSTQSTSETHSEGGFGGYLKLAEGFMKKY